MVKIGLTGGIGAGKSTVSRALSELGAVIIDADAIAREVVEPGSPLLNELSREFGPEVITADGALDRGRLAEIAFADEQSTARLNALIHPAIRSRTAEYFDRHSAAEVVVHDVPLLVENGMSADYHLCILVDVPAELRLRRLVESRGMDRADAEARIARQTDDAHRYAACDIIIDNSGSPAATRKQAESLMANRLLPFARNLEAGRWARQDQESTVESGDVDVRLATNRVIDRIRAGIDSTFTVEPIAAAVVPDRSTVIELQLSVPDLGSADELAPVLTALGYPRRPGCEELGANGHEAIRLHTSADPGQAVNVYVRIENSAGF